MRLLGSFVVADSNAVVALPTDAQRVLALLALQGPTMPREAVAGTLWLEPSQDRATAVSAPPCGDCGATATT